MEDTEQYCYIFDEVEFQEKFGKEKKTDQPKRHTGHSLHTRPLLTENQAYSFQDKSEKKLAQGFKRNFQEEGSVRNDEDLKPTQGVKLKRLEEQEEQNFLYKCSKQNPSTVSSQQIDIQQQPMDLCSKPKKPTSFTNPNRKTKRKRAMSLSSIIHREIFNEKSGPETDPGSKEDEPSTIVRRTYTNEGRGFKSTNKSNRNMRKNGNSNTVDGNFDKYDSTSYFKDIVESQKDSFYTDSSKERNHSYRSHLENIQKIENYRRSQEREDSVTYSMTPKPMKMGPLKLERLKTCYGNDYSWLLHYMTGPKNPALNIIGEHIKIMPCDNEGIRAIERTNCDTNTWYKDGNYQKLPYQTRLRQLAKGSQAYTSSSYSRNYRNSLLPENTTSSPSSENHAYISSENHADMSPRNHAYFSSGNHASKSPTGNHAQTSFAYHNNVLAKNMRKSQNIHSPSPSKQTVVTENIDTTPRVQAISTRHSDDESIGKGKELHTTSSERISNKNVGMKDKQEKKWKGNFLHQVLKHEHKVFSLSCGQFSCRDDIVLGKLQGISDILLHGFTSAHLAVVSESTRQTDRKIKYSLSHLQKESEIQKLMTDMIDTAIQFTAEFAGRIRSVWLLPEEVRKIQIVNSIFEMAVLHYTYRCTLNDTWLFDVFNANWLSQRIERSGPIDRTLLRMIKSSMSLMVLQLSTKELALIAALILFTPDRTHGTGMSPEHANQLRHLEEIVCVALKYTMSTTHGYLAQSLFEQTLKELNTIRRLSDRHSGSLLSSMINSK